MAVHPGRWLAEQAKTGLKELPSNASWLMSRIGEGSGPGEGKMSELASNARRRAEQVKDSVVEAAPIGDDSVELRMKRAREQAERAKDAEERALELARDAKEKAAEAKRVGDEGRARIEEQEKEGDREVEERTAAAEAEAQAAIARAREEASSQAEQDLRDVQEEAHADARAAQERAEKAKEEAQEAMAAATEELAEARRLADEAEQAARDRAEQAHREAERLADEARQQADDAESRVTEAKRVGRQAAETSPAGRSRNGGNGHRGGELKAKSKAELLDMASSIDLQGRSRMSKEELVRSIAASAGGRARAKSQA